MNYRVKTVAIIPARIESIRLPRKALLEICGLPMIVHVYKRCMLSKKLDEVYVATDSLEIKKIVEIYGGKVIMTSSKHQTGTDRIAEAAQDIDAEIIVNIQGDEALVNPLYIDKVVAKLEANPDINVGMLVNSYSKKNRRPLPFILLSSNLAAITAWSNDFTYKDYVSRELDVFGSRGDVLILFSTSGGNIKKKQSLNLIKLANLSNKKNITVISLLGKGGGVLKKISSKSIVVNSNNTGSIQEMHKMIFHSICAYLDNHF